MDLLGIPGHHLDWFADSLNKQRLVSEGPLQHYNYKWVFKKNGTARLIEIPKYRLKEIQKTILKQILDRIPVHDAVHGFVKERSCLTGARLHTNSTVIMKMDLKDFFLNIGFRRIQALYKRAGYPENVARYLTGLCTNGTPLAILQKAELMDHDIRFDWETRKKFSAAHLPQGAPSSPALSNLCAYKIDLRLEKASLKYGAIYTRYADDLVFSGDDKFSESILRFHDLVCRIIHEEGFSINPRKTRIMKQGVQQKICGIVVNERPNIDRKSYDVLKALLFNCIRFGPESQRRSHANFKEHLQGKIGFIHMIHPSRAEKLISLFNKINWN
jgi:retron-type reverse transcriptase